MIESKLTTHVEVLVVGAGQAGVAAGMASNRPG
jgi:cation diffusion facilitator CzcD-associated flavoprotein CzcO